MRWQALKENGRPVGRPFFIQNLKNPLDLHVHDVLVGGYHAVAHLDHGLE